MGECNVDFPPHRATNAAILQSNRRLGQDVKADWVSTANIEMAMIAEYSAIWVAPGAHTKIWKKYSFANVAKSAAPKGSTANVCATRRSPFPVDNVCGALELLSSLPCGATADSGHPIGL